MPSDLSTHSLTPMTLAEGKALVRRYLGSFPSLNLHDPEIYIADLCSLLCAYPLWAGEKAIEAVKDTLKFPTTRAEIKPVLEDQVRASRYAAEWEERAQKMLGERTLMLSGPDDSERRAEQAAAWLNRTDPIAKKLTESESETTKARKALTTEKIEEANRVAFNRECAAAGVDPALGVSPSLLKLLEAK